VRNRAGARPRHPLLGAILNMEALQLDEFLASKVV
jgi:hypothetical protein